LSPPQLLLPEVKDEQWDLFGPEFPGLGFYSDGARRPFPPCHRALKSAGVPVAPLLRRAGLTPELIAEPEERLSVRGQIALARDFDLRKFGLRYYLCVAARLFKR
jgi:hypothetical protein